MEFLFIELVEYMYLIVIVYSLGRIRKLQEKNRQPMNHK